MKSSNVPEGYSLTHDDRVCILRMESSDATNRLRRAMVDSLFRDLERLEKDKLPLIITATEHFFSAGADLNEIAELRGAKAYDFALAGQRLMNAIDGYPAPVIAAIDGYCMGGGLDLALACDFRICSPKSIFGHRGAALGIMTGWGGTQRLPRLIGKSRALQMFLAAEKIHAAEALHIGLVDEVSANPTRAATEWINSRLVQSPLYSRT